MEETSPRKTKYYSTIVKIFEDINTYFKFDKNKVKILELHNKIIYFFKNGQILLAENVVIIFYQFLQTILLILDDQAIQSRIKHCQNKKGGKFG